MKAGEFDRKGRNDHIENFFKPDALLCLKVFAACANFPIHETSRIRIFLPPRREERQVLINIVFFFAAFACLREILRFFWLRLRRARFSAVVSTGLFPRLFLGGIRSGNLSRNEAFRDISRL